MTNQFPATDEFADVGINYNTTAAITVVMQDRTSPAFGFELTPCQDLAIRCIASCTHAQLASWVQWAKNFVEKAEKKATKNWKLYKIMNKSKVTAFAMRMKISSKREYENRYDIRDDNSSNFRQEVAAPILALQLQKLLAR